MSCSEVLMKLADEQRRARVELVERLHLPPDSGRAQEDRRVVKRVAGVRIFADTFPATELSPELLQVILRLLSGSSAENLDQLLAELRELSELPQHLEAEAVLAKALAHLHRLGLVDWDDGLGTSVDDDGDEEDQADDEGEEEQAHEDEAWEDEEDADEADVEGEDGEDVDADEPPVSISFELSPLNVAGETSVLVLQISSVFGGMDEEDAGFHVRGLATMLLEAFDPSAGTPQVAFFASDCPHHAGQTTWLGLSAAVPGEIADMLQRSFQDAGAVVSREYAPPRRHGLDPFVARTVRGIELLLAPGDSIEVATIAQTYPSVDVFVRPFRWV